MHATYMGVVFHDHLLMDQQKLRKLTNRIPELKSLDFKTTDELVALISANNRLLWPAIKELIYLKIDESFKKEGLQISQEQLIYDPEYFGYYSNSKESQLSESLDLTFPSRGMSKASFRIISTTTLAWIIVLIGFLSANPEWLLFGLEIIIPNFLLLIGIPYLIMRFNFPKLIAKEKFKGVETFEDLTEDMYGLNLWRYRTNDFQRLKLEVTEQLKSS